MQLMIKMFTFAGSILYSFVLVEQNKATEYRIVNEHYRGNKG